MFAKSRPRSDDGRSSLLVTALLEDPLERGIWIWDLLARVRPQLGELIAMTDTGLICPDFDKVLARNPRPRDLAAGRRRIVLVAAASDEERHVEITHWHVKPGAASGAQPPLAWAAPFESLALTPVAQCVPRTPRARSPLLPFWLDDDLPPEGLDYVQLPWPRAARGESGRAAMETAIRWNDPSRAEAIEFVGPHAAALRVTCSALLGVLWQIVREMGSRSMSLARAA